MLLTMTDPDDVHRKLVVTELMLPPGEELKMTSGVLEVQDAGFTDIEQVGAPRSTCTSNGLIVSVQ